jgi:hypothetical protein
MPLKSRVRLDSDVFTLGVGDLSKVGALLIEVLPVGSIGQEKGDSTRADFLMPATSGVSTARARTRGLAALIL